MVGDTAVLTLEGANLDKIKDRLGLKKAHKEVRCIEPPIGCGREIAPEEFQDWDPLSVKEYAMSGMCKTPCQDNFFGEDPEPVCTCGTPCCRADVGVGVISCGTQHCRVHGEDAWYTAEDGPQPPNDNLIPEELVH